MNKVSTEDISEVANTETEGTVRRETPKTAAQLQALWMDDEESSDEEEDEEEDEEDDEASMCPEIDPFFEDPLSLYEDTPIIEQGWFLCYSMINSISIIC